jgi:hypothetical protein
MWVGLSFRKTESSFEGFDLRSEVSRLIRGSMTGGHDNWGVAMAWFEPWKGDGLSYPIGISKYFLLGV